MQVELVFVEPEARVVIYANDVDTALAVAQDLLGREQGLTPSRLRIV